MKKIISTFLIILIPICIYPQTQTTLTDLGRLAAHTTVTPNVYNGSATSGSYLYSAGDGKVYIYKMTDPKNPTYIKTVPSLTNAQRVWTGENYMFVYTGTAVKIYDLTDPENPLFKSDYSAGVDLHKVSAKGNYMFVLYMMEYNTGKDGSFEIVDITDAANPQLRGTYKPSNYEGRSFFFSETANRVYVAHYANASGQGYIREIDYSVPTNPTIVREFTITGAPIEISVSGTTMFVLKDGGWQGPSKLEAYDLSVTPIAQSASLQVSSERAWDMHVYGNSITVTLLESNGFKNYTWNATTKVFENGVLLNIPNASQISWYMVSTQGSGSIQTLRKNLGGYWIYFYYYIVEKSPSSMESETYGYYLRLVEIKIWIDVPDVNVTLITSVQPADAAADGSTVTPTGTNQYSKNSIVSLLATAATGWVFDKWTGSITGSQNPQNLTMDNDKNVVGNFQPVLTLSLSSPADNYLCPPGQNEELTIATANIFVDGVNWLLTGISFSVVNKFKPRYTEAWIEYSGTKLKGTISTDADSNAVSVSFSPNKQIDEGTTLAVRLFYKFNSPSKLPDKYVPVALDEIKKYKVSIQVGQVSCTPIPESARPGVKTPAYPPNIFYSNTQTVASVWNVSKDPDLPFATIKEAVESSQTLDDDLIRVCPGWYSEIIVVDKRLTIFSSGGAQSAIIEAVDKHHAYERNEIFTLKKSGTKIFGFTLRMGSSGILIANGAVKVNSCEVKENIFEENYNSISITNGDSNNLHDNTTKNKIRILDGNSNIIEKNTIGIFDSDGSYQVGISIGGNSSKNIIRDNVIGGNRDAGIVLEASGVTETEIKLNKIGTNSDGTSSKPNRHGIDVKGSNRNNIENNLISGNTESGILLEAWSNSNDIKNNTIGLNNSKTEILANNTGIKLDQNNQGNLIEGNVVSGNALGIHLSWNCENNSIKNNTIGSNELGADKLPNAMGILISTGSVNNVVENNVISSNVSSLSIAGRGTSNNTVINNKFGTNADGTKTIATVLGIGITGNAANNLITNNLISGHAIALMIGGEQTVNNVIENNKIGVDITGRAALPNVIGITILEGAKNNSIHNNLISGNSTFGTANQNSGFGVFIAGNTTSKNLVYDNIFGLDVNGSQSIPNDFAIALYQGSFDNTIRGNTIGNSKNVGISVYTYAYRNTICNNFIGTNSSGSISAPNKAGIEINQGNENIITQNKIWNNETGINIITGDNNIAQNDIRNNTGNTGIHLNNSNSEIFGNIITNDKTDAIKCENGSNPILRNNNIYNNLGFGLLNADASVNVNATNNWWGTANGPGNTVSGNVNSNNWLTDENKLNVYASVDTLFIPENGSDSVSVFYNNSSNSSDKLLIIISSAKVSWITSGNSFTADLSLPNSGESKIKFQLPTSLSGNETATFIISAVSQLDPALVAHDIFYTSVYKSQLSLLKTSPDTVGCMPGDTLKFIAVGYDQHRNTVPISFTWSADGGTIDQDGNFIAGNVNGLFKITAEENSKNLKSFSYVKIGSYLTSVEEKKVNEELPSEYSLSQNYPNPFNPITKINYSIPQSSRVRITIYNILGQIVKELANEEKLPGNYILNWDATKNASGIYICRIMASGSTKTYVKSIKMILLK
ncbi:MAG: hypothetical protein FIA82_10160 [Melioribacter sp.]|nr:hypothetical protein [Melioribacter sp.]